MADYYLTCVCRNQRHGNYGFMLRDPSGKVEGHSRRFVIRAIQERKQVVVVDHEPYPEVHVVKGKWLRTDPNETESDNLDESPDCEDKECIALRLVAEQMS